MLPAEVTLVYRGKPVSWLATTQLTHKLFLQQQNEENSYSFKEGDVVQAWVQHLSRVTGHSPAFMWECVSQNNAWHIESTQQFLIFIHNLKLRNYFLLLE